MKREVCDNEERSWRSSRWVATRRRMSRQKTGVELEMAMSEELGSPNEVVGFVSVDGDGVAVTLSLRRPRSRRIIATKGTTRTEQELDMVMPSGLVHHDEMLGLIQLIGMALSKYYIAAVIKKLLRH